jgi:hypothetical protein
MAKTAEELQKELDTTKAQAEENIKALQKKLADRDLEVKTIQEEIEKLKTSKPEDSAADAKIEALTKQVEALTGQIGNLNTDKEKEDLAKKYPDILPELLVGRNPEEQEIIVTKQREITMRNYDQKPSAHGPVYKDRNEAEEAIERINKDPKLSIPDKMTKIREIKEKINEI